MSIKEGSPPTPPGILASLRKGFELTTSHVWVLLLPALLDIFFWLGPRLSLRPVIEDAIALWQDQLALLGANAADPGLGDMMAQMVTLAPQTNLFTSLSIPVIGIPTLFNGPAPALAPLSLGLTEVQSAAMALLLFVVLSLAGLGLSMVYFDLCAQVLRFGGLNARALLQRLPLNWVQFLFLGLFLVVITLIVYIPMLIVAAVVSLFSPGLATLTLFVAPFIVISLILYMVFTLHGVILAHRPVWWAIVDSFRIIRKDPLATLGLVIAFILLGFVDGLWLLADNGSWLTLISIFGHAFLNTSLIMATFEFYRSRRPTLVLTGPYVRVEA